MKTKIFSCFYRNTDKLEKDLDRFYKNTDIIDFISLKEFVVQDKVIIIITYVGEEIEQEKQKPKETKKVNARYSDKRELRPDLNSIITNTTVPTKIKPTEDVSVINIDTPDEKYGSEPNLTLHIADCTTPPPPAIVDLNNADVQNC